MRILVTNDDGIHAPGLKVLETIARKLSKDVWVVAPEAEQSGAAHSLTLTEPLRVRKITSKKYSVRGTPTDCVMLAVSSIMVNSKPDLVLSGVNRGANLGEDVTYSGTVAAAMEGTLLGIPSIALSQTIKFTKPVKWSTAEHHAPDLITKLLKAGWPPGVLINVNFPDVLHDQVTGVKVVSQGQRELSDSDLEQRIDPRGVPYYWIGFRKEGGRSPMTTDLGVVANGGISITPLQLDLTHTASLAELKKRLS